MTAVLLQEEWLWLLVYLHMTLEEAPAARNTGEAHLDEWMHVNKGEGLWVLGVLAKLRESFQTGRFKTTHPELNLGSNKEGSFSIQKLNEVHISKTSLTNFRDREEKNTLKCNK